MLARHQRLTTAQFAKVFTAGTMLRHALMQARMVCSQGTENSPMRAAFVAPRKLGGAVVRNQLRRRLGEAFRAATRGKTEVLAGCEFIFIATPAARGATLLQLTEAFDQLLRRAARQRKENGG